MKSKKKNEEIHELSSKISSLETQICEKDKTNRVISEIQEKIEEHEKKFERFFEALDKGLDMLRDRVEVFGENIDDLAVELNDDIGNLTIESDDKSFGDTFKNPFLEFKCCVCDFIAKSERGLKTHKSRKHCNCNWCDFICNDEKELKKHKIDKHSMEYSVELLQGCYL